MRVTGLLQVPLSAPVHVTALLYPSVVALGLCFAVLWT
jgi:hypothetical protein